MQEKVNRFKEQLFKNYNGEEINKILDAFLYYLLEDQNPMESAIYYTEMWLRENGLPETKRIFEAARSAGLIVQ